MPGLVAQPMAAPDAQGDEGSAYVHWWRQVEFNAASPEAAGIGFLTFGQDGTGPAPRFAAHPGPNHPGHRRTLPIWKSALLPTGSVGRLADPLAKLTAPAVLVVIDGDINPVHDRFRDGAGKPRILAHWLMEAAYQPGSSRVPFGREIRRAEIETATVGRTEDEALRHLGCHSLSDAFAPRGTAQLSAHGTHVLDLAGGTRTGDHDAALLRTAPVLAVSLPSNRLLSASGVFLEVFVDQALTWVEQRLDEMAGNDWPPVVINLSYGLAAGPKDGSGHLSRRILAFLTRHPSVQIFMPAGNDGLGEGHAMLVAGGDHGKIGWIVSPSDPYSSHAEVWVNGNAPAISLVLTSPDGDRLEMPGLAGAGPHRPVELVSGGGKPVARIYPLGHGITENRHGYLICVAPTRRYGAGLPAAPGGIWTIALSGAGDATAALHLQSERPLTPNSLAGHPGRLVQLSGQLAKPQRDGTLNALPVGSGAQIIDCLRASDGKVVGWSARGDRLAVPPIPDGFAVRGERSPARPNLLAAGYRSGSTALVEGTSFACAAAARTALMVALTAP